MIDNQNVNFAKSIEKNQFSPINNVLRIVKQPAPPTA